MSEQCKACGQIIEYNGWKNYETWAVNLWLTNDQGTYVLIKNMVKGTDLHEASNLIQAYIEENNPLIDNGSVYSDLIDGALSLVEWHSVAETFLQK